MDWDQDFLCFAKLVPKSMMFVIFGGRDSEYNSL